MVNPNNGKYQSGREVFEKFIPNYTVPRTPAERPILEGLEEDSAAELVHELLKDLSQQFASITKYDTATST